MNHVCASIGELLFPRHCLLCHHPAGSPFFRSPSPSFYTPFLCSDCASGLKKISSPICPTCGYPRDHGEKKHRCVLRTRGIAHQLSLIRSGYEYEGMMMEIIHQWKYQRRHLLLPLVEKLVDEAMDCWLADYPEVDMVAAVPLAAPDWRARGFNQALVIANRCAVRLGKPLERCLLKKRRRTSKQATLHRASRMTNLAGVFSLGRPDALNGKKILLCDDVMTTGATLAVAGDTLLRAGAREVVCFTLCRVL